MENIDKVAIFKMYLETAEKTSDRRLAANTWLLSVNSLVCGMYGYLKADALSLTNTNEKTSWLLIIPAVGLIISVSWLRIIAAYRKLNSAKFRVLQEYESEIGTNLFRKEQDFYKSDKRNAFSKVESGIPLAFIVLYGLVMLTSAFSLT